MSEHRRNLHYPGGPNLTVQECLNLLPDTLIVPMAIEAEQYFDTIPVGIKDQADAAVKDTERYLSQFKEPFGNEGTWSLGTTASNLRMAIVLDTGIDQRHAKVVCPHASREQWALRPIIVDLGQKQIYCAPEKERA